jgi:hypothetical protein
MFGPHAIGAERFVAVSSGAWFAQVAGVIQQKQARWKLRRQRRFIAAP